MDIALLFGTKGQQLLSTLKRSLDNMDMRAFKNIDEFINYIRQSNMSCSRILANTNNINDRESLETLYRFLRSELPSTSVVFLVSSTDTSNIQETFAEIFDLSIYTDVTVQQASEPFLIECMTEDITELQERYSDVDRQSLDDESNEMVEQYDDDFGDQATNDDQASQAMMATAYDSPIQTTDAFDTIIPTKKDQERIQAVQLANEENQQYGELVMAHGTAMHQTGYFTGKHYPLNLADVDPKNPLFKKRHQSNDKRTIRPYQSDQSQLKNQLSVVDWLRINYEPEHPLTLAPFVEKHYQRTPLAELAGGGNGQTGMATNAQPTKKQQKAEAKKQKKPSLFGKVKGFFMTKA